MPDNKVVSHEEWLKARLELLAAEKKFMGQRDWHLALRLHRLL